MLGCAAGAGAALLASARTWVVERTARPAPLPSLTSTHTGAVRARCCPRWPGGPGRCRRAAGQPWSRAYAVGVVLVLAGLGVVRAAGKAATGRPGVFVGWALVCLVGAAMIAAVGVLSVLRGRGWPGLGARYDRHPAGRRPPQRRSSTRRRTMVPRRRWRRSVPRGVPRPRLGVPPPGTLPAGGTRSTAARTRPRAVTQVGPPVE